MKYLLIAFVAFISFQCSPKIAPDAGWARQRWVVTEMKGVPVQQSGSRKDAFISFEINEKRISGNGGCNTLNGNYTIDRSKLTFNDITTTKMMCADIEFENTFINQLREVDRYEVKDNLLHLKNGKKTVLVLRSF